MIYVFKTSVKTKKDFQNVSQFLNDLLFPQKWSFDLEDCDKVLRVECQNNATEIVKNGLRQRGFECEELE